MPEETIIVWKCTRKNGQPTHGSRPLPQPKNGRPGAWHDTGMYPVLCESGVHGCRTARDLIFGNWLNEELWIAELRGPFAEEEGRKIAGRSGRLLYRVTAWNEQTARLFAADCAESVAHLNSDPRVSGAILAARRFAFGMIDDAAWSAARSAAWSAAESAAWSAAESAAWSAARSAARSAAWSAAWSAAESAAESAAWSAAESAAWSAAESAATTRFGEYVTGTVDIEAIRKSVMP